MNEANSEMDKNVVSISDEVMGVLEKYPWPGNLRELRNVIRRSVLFTQGDTLTLNNLPNLDVSKSEKTEEDTIFEGEEFKDVNERDRIIIALKKMNGNKTKTAQMLKIDRKTLYNKLHLYNIEL